MPAKMRKNDDDILRHPIDLVLAPQPIRILKDLALFIFYNSTTLFPKVTYFIASGPTRCPRRALLPHQQEQLELLLRLLAKQLQLGAIIPGKVILFSQVWIVLCSPNILYDLRKMMVRIFDAVWG